MRIVNFSNLSIPIIFVLTLHIWEIINNKMFITPLFLTLLMTLINGILTKSVELTFELPDSAVECFYQDIEKNTSAALEYQVIYISYSIFQQHKQDI